MTLSRPIRRIAALAAAFGIALQALWPAIAQAAPKNSISVPVCSVGGVQHEIELPLGKTNDGTQHCKLCVLGTDKAAAVPSGIVFDLLEGTEQKFFARAIQPDPSRNIASAHPRAPPFAS